MRRIAIKRVLGSRIGGMAVLALLLGGALAVPTTLCAQNVTAEASTRKVRSKVVPAYPDLARQTHITGKVKLEANVSADGRVLGVKVVGGSPVLVSAATEALNKWRFEAGTNETTETIEFAFSGLN
jgi:TonB family protein